MVDFQKGFILTVAFRQLTAKPLITQLIKESRSLLRQLIKVVSPLFPLKLLLRESLRYTRLKGTYELTHKETRQVGLSSLSFCHKSGLVRWGIYYP